MKRFHQRSKQHLPGIPILCVKSATGLCAHQSLQLLTQDLEATAMKILKNTAMSHSLLNIQGHESYSIFVVLLAVLFTVVVRDTPT